MICVAPASFVWQRCCGFLLRVSATWAHGEVIDGNSLPERKGRREKRNAKKNRWEKKKKKVLRKKIVVHIFTSLWSIFAWQPHNTTWPLPLLSQYLHVLHGPSPTSFEPVNKDREQGHFFLGQQKSWCMELRVGFLLQTEHSKSAMHAVSPGMGNLTTLLHLQTITQGLSETFCDSSRALNFIKELYIYI